MTAVTDHAAAKKQEILHQFRTLDKNDDGKLDFNELKGLLSKGKKGLTDKECRVLFDAVDTDRNGTVDVEEFLAFIFDGPSSSSSRARRGSRGSIDKVSDKADAQKLPLNIVGIWIEKEASKHKTKDKPPRQYTLAKTHKLFSSGLAYSRREHHFADAPNQPPVVDSEGEGQWKLHDGSLVIDVSSKGGKNLHESFPQKKFEMKYSRKNWSGGVSDIAEVRELLATFHKSEDFTIEEILRLSEEELTSALQRSDLKTVGAASLVAAEHAEMRSTKRKEMFQRRETMRASKLEELGSLSPEERAARRPANADTIITNIHAKFPDKPREEIEEMLEICDWHGGRAVQSLSL